MAYKFFQVRISSEEVLQAHVPILPAPEDPMAALWEAHIAAPGFLQLGILSCACTHQHLQTLHTEAPVSRMQREWVPRLPGNRPADRVPWGTTIPPYWSTSCLQVFFSYRVKNHFLDMDHPVSSKSRPFQQKGPDLTGAPDLSPALCINPVHACEHQIPQDYPLGAHFLFVFS